MAVGGRLCQFAERWQGVTEDKWLLDTLATGYRVEFTGSCRLSKCPVWTRVPRKPERTEDLRQGLADLLSKNAIREVHPSREQPGFFSTLFLTEKKSGGWRPILNLKRLNKAVIPKKFKMETLRSVLSDLGESRLRRETESRLDPDRYPEPGPWAVSLDLKDAYFHVRIHPEHTRFE